MPQIFVVNEPIPFIVQFDGWENFENMLMTITKST